MILTVGTLGLIASCLAWGADVPIVWNDIASLSLSRHSGAVVEADGWIYVIGGIEYGNQMTVYGQTYDVTTGTLMEAYNPATDSWIRLADLPYPINLMARQAEGRQWPAAAVYQGRIYLFGGANINGEVRDTIDVYDIATGTWTAGIASLPNPVCGMSAVTIDDTIYLFGGSTSVDPFAPYDYVGDSYAFDPSTYSIRKIASMPSARFKTTAMPVENGVLVLGGISASASANVQVYHPASDEWELLEPVFWERRFWGGAEVDGSLFLIGGRDEHSLSSSVVDVRVPSIDAWLVGDPMRVAREDAFTIAVDDVLYVFGGRTHEGSPLAVCESGLPDVASASHPAAAAAEDEFSFRWSLGAPMPTPRYFGATATVGGRIYTIGGLEADNPTGRVVEAYDPIADTWTTAAPLPAGRFNLAAAVVNDIIYVFGGAEVDGRVTDTIYAFDPEADAWSLVGSLPNAVAGMSVTAFEDRIYVFGGSHSSQMFVPKENYYADAYAFDPATATFESLPPMPVARNMAICVTLEDDIVVVGGMKSPGATANQRYRPPYGTWEIQAEMPTPRGGAVGVYFPTVTTNAVLVLGGANQVDVHAYQPVEDRWFQAGAIPAPRNMAFTATVAHLPNHVLLIGGIDETGQIVDTVYLGESVGPDDG